AYPQRPSLLLEMARRSVWPYVREAALIGLFSCASAEHVPVLTEIVQGRPAPGCAPPGRTERNLAACAIASRAAREPGALKEVRALIAALGPADPVDDVNGVPPNLSLSAVLGQLRTWLDAGPGHIDKLVTSHFLFLARDPTVIERQETKLIRSA